MEPQSKRYLSEDVVEILPNDFPSSSSGDSRKNRSKRAKKVVLHDVIVIDGDEDSFEVLITNDDKVNPGNKGKEKLMGYDKSWVNQVKLNSSFSDGNDDIQVWMPKDVENRKKQASNNGASFVTKSCSRKDNEVEEDEVSKKFRLFKKFDTVSDFSDHRHTIPESSNSKQASSWSKTIQQEWKILEKDLPDTIFVRVYEERMDLLRAVIVGAAGTPYHDGLFFFDFYFPPTYPNVPPKVHYHSGGVRLNPNLYACGKVCLSLLNTWQGNKNEKWTPRKSTVLQVLLSIQALVLNAKPYFNEPGYERTAGTPHGEKMAETYNENTYLLSCRTMLFSLKRPPMHFKDFVVGHFREHARGILVACKAYMEGAQVGCLVGGGVQDVDEGDKSSSKDFQMQIADMVKLLVPAFKELGAKGCEQFLPKTSNTGNQVTNYGGYQVPNNGFQVSFNNAYQPTYNNGYQMPLNSGFPAPYNGYQVPLNSGYQAYSSGGFVNPNPITSMYKSLSNS